MIFLVNFIVKLKNSFGAVHEGTCGYVKLAFKNPIIILVDAGTNTSPVTPIFLVITKKSVYHQADVTDL